MVAQTTDNQTPSYDAGPIKVEGAFTAEILIAARVSLQDVWNDQYAGSQVMGKRPGMYIKYLPSRYHEVNGDMLVGGSYLFDKYEDAENYQKWTSNEFEVGEPKTTFWKQPLFKSASHWAWKVIGAHNFAPVDEHALGRLQRWTYDPQSPAMIRGGVESLLRQHYPVMKDAAESRGATSFWLLHRPEDKMIAVQMSFPKPEKEGDDSTRESLVSIADGKSVGDVFPDALNAELVFDRTSVLLAVWLPLAKHAKGVKVESPNLPAFPALSSD
ncbi:hypothetical protein FALBO_15850 [Fusarium albosuccineum]|uniref:Uncharacterized protein n=1 Tax=Fusarium albosuccineum TaxID=1237068 RepID=A0A8H4P090_9HYPO|nr:hypothetical protein FALBO_15850 [Fusarium albosuccineum]